MAFGSRGSAVVASSNQAVKSRSGSSAWVKSPLVNQLGCSIGFVSDIALKQSFRRSRYSGTVAARLWRGTLAAAVALALGACSLDLDSISIPKPDLSDITGSIGRKAPEAQASVQLPPEADLALTRAAVNEVLSGAKDTSVPWENQTTGARGTVTPLASAYTMDNTQCRDFLASYVTGGGKESWLRGEACRETKGSWQVRALKPWIRS
jgi:surface antigen